MQSVPFPVGMLLQTVGQHILSLLERANQSFFVLEQIVKYYNAAKL